MHTVKIQSGFENVSMGTIPMCNFIKIILASIFQTHLHAQILQGRMQFSDLVMNQEIFTSERSWVHIPGLARTKSTSITEQKCVRLSRWYYCNLCKISIENIFYDFSDECI